MKKNMTSSLQEWLIALALIIVLPVTVSLGIRLISPKVAWEKYSVGRQAFFKKHKHGDSMAEHDRVNQQWQKTDLYEQEQKEVAQLYFVRVIMGGIFSVVLLYIGSILMMPIVASSMILSGLILQIGYGWSDHISTVVYGLNVGLLAILFALVGLMIVLWAAYKNSKE